MNEDVKLRYLLFVYFIWQFYEEDEYKARKIEGEAGEVKSEITVKSAKENSKISEVKKLDYIHVRARRGQATDSHSLAERVSVTTKLSSFS